MARALSAGHGRGRRRKEVVRYESLNEQQSLMYFEIT